MRVLLIKTSSLGDLLHTMPALTDAQREIQEIRFDWVVEEAFAEVPAWHPAVDQVIPVAIRRWRKSPLKAILSGEWSAFRKQLVTREYDLVLDAQGLIKSALITRMARGLRVGLDSESAREPLSSRFYDQVVAVQKGEHAILRLRKLFARSIGYRVPEYQGKSGICNSSFTEDSIDDETMDSDVHFSSQQQTILFVHGTTWKTKHWPEVYWIELAEIVNRAGYRVMLPWGGEQEKERAEKIASGHDAVVLPKCSLSELSHHFQQCSAMVCVDSGLAHLGAALSIPSVTIYGATSMDLIGTMGGNQHHLIAEFECAPCMKRICSYSGYSRVKPACYQQITPQYVWQKLSEFVHLAG